MRELPRLNLDDNVEESLEEMEWRSVIASGSYDFNYQIAIRNQYYAGQLGYHLITPLVISPSTIVLVDRGWIPFSENPVKSDWEIYNETGAVTVTGQIRKGSSKFFFGGIEDPVINSDVDQPLILNDLDLEIIGEQLPYEVMDIYIQQDQNEGDQTPPIPYQPELDLTEGPHFGYALQWFTFAIILCIGYPFYIRKQETLRA